MIICPARTMNQTLVQYVLRKALSSEVEVEAVGAGWLVVGVFESAAVRLGFGGTAPDTALPPMRMEKMREETHQNRTDCTGGSER